MHPFNRSDRRQANRTHPPYDGEKQLLRDMERAYQRMLQLDHEARLSEWDQSVRISPVGWLVLCGFENMLKDLDES